jgi:hypothetical protein
LEGREIVMWAIVPVLRRVMAFRIWGVILEVIEGGFDWGMRDWMGVWRFGCLWLRLPRITDGRGGDPARPRDYLASL